MTLEIPIMGGSLQFDSGVYPSKLTSQMSLTNVKQQGCIVMPFPTGADVGIYGSFRIPPNYASTPVIVIRGVLDGTPANVLAFGVQQLSREVSESIDTAYEAEDVANNSTWTGYTDEDEFEITITLTPAAAYVAGDTIYFYLYRDDSVDTTTFDFLLNPDTCMFRFTET